MVESIRVRHINIITLSILIILIFFQLYVTKKQITDYAIYILPLFIDLLVYIFTKDYKVDTYSFIIGGILGIIFGNVGDLVGAIFLCFGFYCLGNKKYTSYIIAFSMIIIAIAIKFFITKQTIFQLTIFFIGYSYVLIIYYILIHPKKDIIIFNGELNWKQKTTLEMMINGKNAKEIAQKEMVTEGTITRRIGRIRSMYGCANDIQLGIYLAKNGIIKRNSA